MGKKKVVLDTNILISALGYNGNERAILRRGIKGVFSLYLTNDLMEELIKVLEYPKLGFTQSQKDYLKLILSETGNFVPVIQKITVSTRDPSDNIFLEAAISSEADYLISGDKHLLSIGQIGATKIITSSQFLKLIS